MKKHVILRILLTVSILACEGSFAEIVTYKRVAGWEAFGGLSENNKKMCGISTKGKGKWFGVKYFERNEFMTLHFSSSDWSAYEGEQVDVKMKFDDESPWTAMGTAFHMSDGDVGIEVNIPVKQLKLWFDEFRRSNTLRVLFPNDDISDWRVDLAGTPEIANAMGYCLGLMAK